MAANTFSPRKTGWFLLKITATVLLLTFVLSRVDFNEVGKRLVRLTPADSAFILGAFGLSFLVASIRMKLLLTIFKGRLSLAKVFKIFLIGHGYNFFLPGISGGDAVMMLHVYRGVDKNKGIGALTVLCDRLLGFACMGLITLALGLLFFIGRVEAVHRWGLPGILVILLCSFALFEWGGRLFLVATGQWKGSKSRVKRILRSVSIIFGVLAGNRKRFWIWSLSFINHLIYFLLCHRILITVGVDWSLPVTALAMGLVFLATCIPISLGGHGVREIVFSQCLILFGGYTGNPETFEVVTSFSVLLLGFSCAWALIGILLGMSIPKPSHKP